MERRLGDKLATAVGGGYAAIAARAVVGNVINQGVGNLTGSQKGFSWSSVAIAGVGSAAAAFATNQMGLTKFNAKGQLVEPANTKLGTDFGRAAVDAGAFALTQLAVRGGKVNWQQVATDTVTNLIQNRARSIAEDERNAQIKKATTTATREDPALRTYYANLAYAEANRPIGGMTSKAPETGGLTATNGKAYFNGLNSSYVLSPEQENARNGGANFGYGDALGNGVVYDKAQYMKGNIQAINIENAANKAQSKLSSIPNLFGSNDSSMMYRDSLSGLEAINYAKSYNAKTTGEKVGTFVAGGIDSGMLGLLKASNALISDPIGTLKNSAVSAFDFISDISGAAFGNEYSQNKLNERLGPLVTKLQLQYDAGDYYNLGTNFPIIPQAVLGSVRVLTARGTLEASSAVPHGFASADEFVEFGNSMRTGLGRAGYGNAEPILQGSAVTGKSFKTGELFDVGRISDFDIGLADPSMLARAKEVGIGLRSGGTRTGPLSARDLRVLGLRDLSSQMGQQVGRQVNFMIYNDPATAIQRAPSVILPGGN